MAEISLKRLNTTDKMNYPENTLTDYYDILHKLMEANALIKGVKIKGEGSHQELINYIVEVLKLNEETRLFMQNMRDYRNRINYEGLRINENYIEQNEKTIIDIINDFLEIMK